MIYPKTFSKRLIKHKSELAELEQKSNNLDDYIRHEKENGASRDEVILMQAHKPLIRQYIRKIKVDLRRLENKLNRADINEKR